jgi:hypothetical protein
MATEIVRRAANGNGNVSLDSVKSIAGSKQSSATERELAAEVAATFALTDLVASLVGLPFTASIPELRDALEAKMALYAPKR